MDINFSAPNGKKVKLPKLKLKKKRNHNQQSSNSKSSCSLDISDSSHNESLNIEMDGDSDVKSSSEIQEEISENISANISSQQTSESCDLTPKFFDNISANESKPLQRNSFDTENNGRTVFPSTSRFDIDDLELSAKNIAEHFKLDESDQDEEDKDEEKPKTPPILCALSFRNKRKLLQQNNDVDSLDQILNDIDSPKDGTFKSDDKELTPLNEDVVLINDNKVSLNSLKKHQRACEDNSLSTTHDISDLAKDTEESEKHTKLAQESTKEEIDAEESKSNHESSIEEDNSIEELVITNNSIEISGLNNLSSLDPNINIDDESMMNKLLQSTIEIQDSQIIEKVMSPISDLRERIMQSSKSFEELKAEIVDDEDDDHSAEIASKPMEKVTDFKEPLEDISEESEFTSSHRATERSTSLTVEKGKEIRKILEEKIMSNKLQVSPVNSLDENKENIPDSNSMSRTHTFDFDSVVSLNLFQVMESKVKELQEVVAGKDACLQALNIQIDNYSRRSSIRESRGDSMKDMMRNSTESNSLATNSTEYRTIHDEMVIGKMVEIQNEILSRDQLIEQLSTSLQQSMQVREQLQEQGEKLTTEVNQLRKSLAETMETLKKANNESNDYRLSQISCDLVSDTDYGSNLPDDDVKDDHFDDIDFDINEQNPLFQIPSTTLSREVEHFKKLLDPSELRIFNSIQHKFDDFLQQEIDKMIEKYENETKVVVNKLESDKHERDVELSRLRQMLSTVKSGSTEISELRHELEMKHTQEMADLRSYFEKKCADMEKQYSEDVFSQQSKKMADDNSTDVSDEEEFPEENGGYHTRHDSPKKREIFASPTHQKITPTNLDDHEKDTGDDLAIIYDSIQSAKQHYTDKINESNRQNQEIIQNLSAKLKYYEDRYVEDELTSNNPKDNTITKSRSLPPQILTNNINNENISDVQEIVEEYERRLQEQIALARQDILHELEMHIKETLLSETAAEDSHWPPELILLREKFTAESKLEVAQLQIKHEEEMARMKSDFEKQLQRKLKRQTTFDSARDLDKILNERDNLREVSSTLRCVLGELAKYFSICEDDLNNTVDDELQKHGVLSNGPNLLDESNTTNLNCSTVTNYSPRKYLKFTPDVSGIISVIEDPSFVDFISKNRENSISDLHLNLDECMEKLKLEALNILGLSERLCKKTIGENECNIEEEKRDSCEEEDGLKGGGIKRSLLKSFDENILMINDLKVEILNKSGNSLPLDLSNVQTKDEINVHLRELRNRLLKSENERCKLESELAEVLAKQDHLVGELNEARHQLIDIAGLGEVFSEGFGTNALLSKSKNAMSSFSEIQNRAKNILNAQNNDTNNNALLVQLVEEFCREGERYMDDEKREKLDLQSQIILNQENFNGSNCTKIEAADKKLKTTRQFLEDQAAEREQERDDYLKEIELLKAQLKDRDKDKTNYDRANKEERCEECSTLRKEKLGFKKNMEMMEQQMKEFTTQIQEGEDKKNKLEKDLKDSIDKVFTLREIITELETQIESKTINENVMEAKMKQLELYIDAQSRQNESLHQEMESFKTEVIVRGYDEKIASLEEQLKQARPSDEQSVILDQMINQLKDIEDSLEKKTKALEALHANTGTISLSTSPSEDVSVAHDSPVRKAYTSDKQSNESIIPIDELQRIIEKLSKHSRVEDATIKRVLDMEMQMNDFRTGYLELQNERDALQDRMTEQSMKISTLQLKLDEQRSRAEELTRIGTSHLNIKVHDLQNELTTLRDTLDSREKQITNLKGLIENSQKVIEQREKELLESQDVSRSEYEKKLEAELKQKCDEIQLLKEKIKNEMISKKTVPDLMNTIVAEKDAEIEELNEKIQELQKGHVYGKDDDNARTLSDIVSISEYDEADMLMRRMSDQQEGYLLPPNSLPMHDTQSPLFQNQSKDRTRQNEPMTTLFGPPRTTTTPIMASNFFHDATVFAREGASSVTPEMAPRQINFSLVESTKSAESLQKPHSGGATIEEIKEEDEIKILSDIEEEIIDNDKLKLEQEVESLKLDLEKIVVEKNQTIESIRKELKEKNEEISHLNIELAARQKLFDDMNEERKSLQNEVENVKGDLLKLQKLETELNQREVELKAAISNFNEKEEEVRMKSNLVKELETEMEESVKESSHLKQKLVANDSKIDTLQQQIESLNKTINHKDELLSKMEKDVLNYAQNEQKYLENIKNLEVKECDLKILQGKFKDKEHEVQMLNEDNKFLNEDINRLKNDIVRSSSVNSNNSYIQYLKQSCDKVEEELHETKCTLTEKMMSLEKVRLDLSTCEKLVESLNDQMKEKDNYIKQVGDDGNSSVHLALSTFQKKLKEEQNKNEGLEAEIERLKMLLQRSDNSSSPKPFSAEEIAEQIEKELNYSAQLDSSILKAIESDELNSDDEEDDYHHERLIKIPSLKNVSEETEEVEELKMKIKDLQCQLEVEKRNAESIQVQDADIMEKMRLHLDTIIEDRNTLQNLLEEEKNKNERLSNLVSGVQRTKSFDNYLLMKPRSPIDSPRHSRHNRSYDFESENVNRLESEIRLLTAQNERERERARDLQTALDRERNRFEKEISDRNDHMEKLKKELNRICKEKDTIEMELDHEQEKLMLAHKEIDSLEMRIAASQDAESKRSMRRGGGGGSDIEIQMRIQQYEEDKAKMQQTINLLRADIDRGAQRETRLAEELVKENSGSSLNHTVPEEFLIKLKEMNRLLESNTRENRQLAETLHLLTEERRALQQRVIDLESHGSIQPYNNRNDLEERANHLFGKYLRLESHRKALVHQKRYLLIVLATYEENEARTLSLLRAHRPESVFTPPPTPKKRRSFRIAVLAVIAITRMRYIVRRWLSGKYLGSKAIFSHQYYPSGPRRSHSASTNVWARSPNSHFAEYTHSPPSRDRNHQQYLLRPLEAPNLVLTSEMRTRLEDQFNLNSR